MTYRKLGVLSCSTLFLLAACSSNDSPPVHPTPNLDAGPQSDASVDASKPDTGTGDDFDGGSGRDASWDGSPDASHDDDAGDTGAPISCATVSGQPAADPKAPASATSGSVVFAVDSWQLGDTPFDAWKAIGFDVDGKITDSVGGYNACQPAAGASKGKLLDGCSGIDNAWGNDIVKLVEALVPNLSQTATDAARAGHSTMLVKIDGLPSPLASASKVTASIYNAADLGAVPKLDGSDVWPVDDKSVAGGDVTKPLMTFAAGYVNGTTFVSGPSTGAVTIDPGVVAGLPLSHVQLQLQLSADGSRVEKGILSGVLVTTAFEDALQKAAGSISTSLCSSSAFAQVKASIDATQDIGADGTSDPSKACDAISIGLGFTAKPVKLGAAKPVVRQDPCGDGG